MVEHASSRGPSRAACGGVLRGFGQESVVDGHAEDLADVPAQVRDRGVGEAGRGLGVQEVLEYADRP